MVRGGLIYVSHAITGRVMACFGGRRAASARAIDYIVRRAALVDWRAMRAGFAPTSQEPLKIVIRTGRPLAVGDNLGSPTTGHFVVDGKHRARRQGEAPNEIASVAPWARHEARRALEARYPWSWRNAEKKC